MSLLSLDPSINSAGVALFNPAGRLEHSARIRSPYEGDERGLACLSMAAAVAQWVISVGGKPTRFVFEWPQIYTLAKSDGDPNDLIALAGIGMAVATRLLAGGSLVELLTPTPAHWIGSCPKKCPACKRTGGSKKCRICKGSAWNTPRGYRIGDRLSPEEKALVPDQHDVIDGVGLGLFGLGRLKLTAVFPGAV